MILIGQWGTSHGRPDSPDRPREAANRDAAIHRVVQISRVSIEFEDGNDTFNPKLRTVLNQWKTYEEIFAAHAAAGNEVELTFEAYDNGDDSGKHYHGTRRPPNFAPSLWTRRAQSFMAWWNSEPEKRPAVRAWAFCNEAEFDRSGAYTHPTWWLCWLAIKNVVPGPRPGGRDKWLRFSAGNSGYYQTGSGSGNLTHNGWLAHMGHAKANGIILMAHFNGEPLDRIHDELRDIPNRFPGVLVGCNEDRAPASAENSGALARGKEVQRAGGLYYGLFTARTNTNLEHSPDPYDRCCWSTQGTCTGSRANVGIEGCDFAWNWANYEQAKQLAKHLGTWIEGPVPVIEVDGTAPPTQPPVEPPVDPPTTEPKVPMIDQAWTQYCHLRLEHDASVLGISGGIADYTKDNVARGRFDLFVDRLTKHAQEVGE